MLIPGEFDLATIYLSSTYFPCQCYSGQLTFRLRFWQGRAVYDITLSNGWLNEVL